MLYPEIPHVVWKYVEDCREKKGYIPDGDDLDERFGKKYSLAFMCEIIAAINELTPDNHDIDRTRYYLKEEHHGTETFYGAI